MTTTTPVCDALPDARPHAPENFDWQGRTIVLRAVEPRDSLLLRVLGSHVAAAELAHSRSGDEDAATLDGGGLAHRDPAGATAFIAVDVDDAGRCEALGLVRASRDDERGEAALAIALRRDVRGRRLGQRLVVKTVDVLRERGTRQVMVRVLAGNESMRTLLRELGFVMDPRRVTPGRVVYVLDAYRPVGHRH